MRILKVSCLKKRAAAEKVVSRDCLGVSSSDEDRERFNKAAWMM
jgi:hypothetical protein